MAEKLPHEQLADDLMAAGLAEMSFAARTFRYHDFKSDQPDPAMALDRELVAELVKARSDPLRFQSILAIRSKHHNGVYDASKEESEEWASSPAGQEAFKQLIKDTLKR